MQRRLVTALVGIALASVVLVGAGMVVFAQIGARSRAEDKISEQLHALSELLTDGISPAELDHARAALDLESLDLVVITPDGIASVIQIPAPGTAPNDRLYEIIPLHSDVASPALATNEATTDASSAGAGAPEVARFELANPELDRLLDDETIVLNDSAPSTVVQAIRRVDTPPESTDALTIGLLATRRVDAIGTEALVWFVVSALVVLGASTLAACCLARRLTKPIRQIQEATTTIAAGDFEVRVDEDGTTELAELGQAVNSMAGRLEQSRQLNQQFLLSVSHDLRTPLTAISGYAEALTDMAVFDTVRTGDVIRNHAHRLERLVGDLLDLARLDANRFELRWQTVDVNVIVGRAMAGLTREAKGYDLKLRCESTCPALVRADADRLAQAVGNVIDNAIKFAGSEIIATVRASAVHAYIEICDDGPGIPPGDLPFVFDRLYVSSTQPARTIGSTGMGLALVRELTAAMGGTVAAGYRSGGGTRVTLRLPLLR